MTTHVPADKPASMQSCFDIFAGRSLLVTGGTGSFGRAFVKELLLKSQIGRLVVFSRDELKQFDMQNDLVPLDTRGVLRFFIGDVRDCQRLQMAMRGIDFVVHAAAMKQVITAEYNPFECIHTNVLGAENVVQACLANGVERVVALSTDKAASPINLYGASKLASDKIFVAANHLSGADGSKFCVVRYGNVLGSRGSVIPFFKKLIAEGSDHLPITDPRMTRFWISLDEGVRFVCLCMAEMQGGDIYVPKIPSMRVADMASALAPGLMQKTVGIRPGEKLHEVMITEDDSRNTVDLGDRYAIRPSIAFWHGSDVVPRGIPVPENFCYASNTNDSWISADDLRRMMANAAQ